MHYKFKEGSLVELKAWGENETNIRDEDKFIYTLGDNKNFYELNWVIDEIIYESILKWRFSNNLYDKITRYETLIGGEEIETWEFSYEVNYEKITGVTIDRVKKGAGGEVSYKDIFNIEIKYN